MASKSSAVPHISVVVPTYNRRDRLELVLASLSTQLVDRTFETVVVSDGSTDGTHEYLARAASSFDHDVVALSQPNQGPAAARNLGVQHARGELVVFIDDDVVADPDLLRAHCDAHERIGTHGVVIGPMLNPPDHEMSPWVAWEQDMLAKQYRAMDDGCYTATARQFYTGNASLRTEHFRTVGGFDTTFRRAEDVELAYRLADLGLEFHYERAAVGLHYASRSYEAWRRTAYEYGRNDIVFARDLGREWIASFIHDNYRRRHPIVRRLIDRCVESDRAMKRTVDSLERAIEAGSTPARVRRYALSAVYGLEYHRGVADEVGSHQAFRQLIERGGLQARVTPLV